MAPVVDTPEVEAQDSELAEFAQRLEYAREAESATDIGPRIIDGREVVWAPQEGSQTAFLSCPIFECMYHGTRGPGKSDALLMAFAQHVGKGHGQAWRGVIFRQTYPQLADIVAKSERWFRRIFPKARFNIGKMLWTWPGGEVLMFRHMAKPRDYWSYHGWEIPFLAFEELTAWPTNECYAVMFSCCRSSVAGVPRMVRATSNPYGAGHHWIKDRFRLHGQWWKTIIVDDAKDAQGRTEPPRCAIHGHIDENKILLAADPDYKQRIAASASNESMAKAWLSGSWDIVSGGMFDDVWSAEHNCVGEFSIPRTWRMDRSFDWGSSKPFAVLWWATSDGSDLVLPSGRVRSTVRGDLFLVREWYGSTGRPNEGLRMLAVDVAKGIVEREVVWGMRERGVCRVQPGPADSAIFTCENGRSVAQDMEQPVRVGSDVHAGVSWLPADKRPGSRRAGWERMRAMIRAARGEPGRPREHPGLFVVESMAPHFLRTLLVAPRDERDPDDIDTNSEDHALDSARYRCLAAGVEVFTARHVGLY